MAGQTPGTPAGWSQPRQATRGGAHAQTENFSIHVAGGTNDPAAAAKTVGEWAEKWRREKAVEWLGREMPAWGVRCPLKVTITAGGAGGATVFAFGPGTIQSQDMSVQGSLDRILQSVLPHEITHTVLAYKFRRPVPRWADEGAAVLSEDDQERRRHDELCLDQLRAGHSFSVHTVMCLRDYPKGANDLSVLYAQGYSLTRFLVEQRDRATFLKFVGEGMGDQWEAAAQRYYGYQSLAELQQTWIAWCWPRRGNPPAAGGTRIPPLTTPPSSPAPREGVQLIAGPPGPAGPVGPPGPPGVPGEPGRAPDLSNISLQADQAAEKATAAKRDAQEARQGIDKALPVIEAVGPWLSRLPAILGLSISGPVGLGITLGGFALRAWLRRRQRRATGSSAPPSAGAPAQPASYRLPEPIPEPPPRVIYREGPPPPQVVERQREYVTVKEPDGWGFAYGEALKRAADEYPGNLPFITVIESLAEQIHSGQNVKQRAS